MFSCYGKRVMLEKPSEERAMHRVWEHPRQRSCGFAEPAAQPREREETAEVECYGWRPREAGSGSALRLYLWDLEKWSHRGPWQERQLALAWNPYSSAKIETAQICEHSGPPAAHTGRKHTPSSPTVCKRSDRARDDFTSAFPEKPFIPAAGFIGSGHVCWCFLLL